MRIYPFIKAFMAILSFVFLFLLNIHCSLAENNNLSGQYYMHVPQYRPSPQDTSKYLRVIPPELKPDKLGENGVPFYLIVPIQSFSTVGNVDIPESLFWRSNSSNSDRSPEKPDRRGDKHVKHRPWAPFPPTPDKRPGGKTWEKLGGAKPSETEFPDIVPPANKAPQMLPDGRGGYLERDPIGGGYADHRPYDRREFNYLPPCETDLVVRNSLTAAGLAVAGKVLLKAMPKILAAYFGAAATSLSNAAGVFIIPVIDQEKIMYPGMQKKEKMTACLLRTDGKSSNVVLNPVDGEKGCYEVVAEDGNPYLVCCDKLDDGTLACSIDGVPING